LIAQQHDEVRHLQLPLRSTRQRVIRTAQGNSLDLNFETLRAIRVVDKGGGQGSCAVMLLLLLLQLQLLQHPSNRACVASIAMP
jgi:hypothetical protein